MVFNTPFKITNIFLRDSSPVLDMTQIPLDHLYVFAGDSGVFKGHLISKQSIMRKISIYKLPPAHVLRRQNSTDFRNKIET